MAKISIDKDQHQRVQDVLAKYDRGTSTPEDTANKIFIAIHGDMVEIDGARTMEQQYADSVASAQKGFKNQTPSPAHRPQVGPSFTVPDLPPSDGLPLETGDAVIARQRLAESKGETTSAAERPEASNTLAVAEQFGEGAGSQLGTVANPNPPAKAEEKAKPSTKSK